MIPLAMTLKFAFENNKGARWIAVLLGPEAPAEGIPPVKDGRSDKMITPIKKAQKKY